MSRRLFLTAFAWRPIFEPDLNATRGNHENIVAMPMVAFNRFSVLSQRCLLADGRTCRANSEDQNLAVEPQQYEHLLLRRSSERLLQRRRIGGRVHPDQSKARRDGSVE